MNLFKMGFSSKLRKLALLLGLQKNELASADLPCGYTCPFADKCKAFANPVTRKLTDGVNSEFRCYGASLEVAFPSLMRRNWYNYNLVRSLKTSGEITDLLLASIPSTIKVMRLHAFGEFYNDKYFQAWLNVAESKKEISFFTYTKALPYMRVDRPDNFAMIYSYGGLLDNQVKNEPVAYVVENELQAKELGVPVACVNHPADDYLFVKEGKSLALLIHGTQPAKKGL